MNALQNLIHQDLEDLFYSEDGFGQPATYNGKPVTIIPDTGMMQSTSLPGYTVMSQQFRVRQSEVSRPKSGDKLVWSEITWSVTGNPLLDAGDWLVDVTQEVRKIGV